MHLPKKKGRFVVVVCFEHLTVPKWPPWHQRLTKIQTRWQTKDTGNPGRNSTTWRKPFFFSRRRVPRHPVLLWISDVLATQKYKSCWNYSFMRIFWNITTFAWQEVTRKKVQTVDGRDLQSTSTQFVALSVARHFISALEILVRAAVEHLLSLLHVEFVRTRCFPLAESAFFSNGNKQPRPPRPA